MPHKGEQWLLVENVAQDPLFIHLIAPIAFHIYQEFIEKLSNLLYVKEGPEVSQIVSTW